MPNHGHKNRNKNTFQPHCYPKILWIYIMIGLQCVGIWWMGSYKALANLVRNQPAGFYLLVVTFETQRQSAANLVIVSTCSVCFCIHSENKENISAIAIYRSVFRHCTGNKYLTCPSCMHMVHIHWASHARNQWSHARFQFLFLMQGFKALVFRHIVIVSDINYHNMVKKYCILMYTI